MGLKSLLRRLFQRRRAPAPQWEWGLDGVEAAKKVPSPRQAPVVVPPRPEIPAVVQPSKDSVAGNEKGSHYMPDVGILEDEPTVPAEAAAQVILSQAAQTQDAQVSAVLQQVASGSPFSDEDTPKGKVVLVYEDGTEVVLEEGHEMLNDFTRAADRMMRPSGWGRRFAQKVGLGG